MDHVTLRRVCARWSELFQENCNYLVDLDSVAGDGDLGLVMSDGFAAVSAELTAGEETDLGKLLFRVGKILSVKAPSSMGTLLAAGFMNAGKRLKGRDTLDADGCAELLSCIAGGVMDLGKAREGEKTFLDAICPAARAMRACALDLPQAMGAGLDAARQGYEDAKHMVARHGRISFRGEESRGIADPGAAVAVLLVQGLAEGCGEMPR